MPHRRATRGWVLALACWAGASVAGDGTAKDALRACAALQVDTERLACYDREVPRLLSAPTTKAPTSAAAVDAATAALDPTAVWQLPDRTRQRPGVVADRHRREPAPADRSRRHDRTRRDRVVLAEVRRPRRAREAHPLIDRAPARNENARDLRRGHPLRIEVGSLTRRDAGGRPSAAPR